MARKKKISLIVQYNGTFKDRAGNKYTREQGQALLLKNEASIAKWKSSKNVNKVSYEGEQYRGGRVEGRKNLKRTDRGTLINQHNVEFTEEEKKALERAVNRANTKRTKMMNDEAWLPRKKGGKDTGDNIRSLQLMGKESDFIIQRKSKSLQRFKSKADYENYMKHLEHVNSPDYVEESVRAYKRNHMKALENVFGDMAKDVIMKIRMMKPMEYMRIVQSDEDLDIAYIYDPSQLEGRLNQIRTALGMKIKDESYFDGYDNDWW